MIALLLAGVLGAGSVARPPAPAKGRAAALFPFAVCVTYSTLVAPPNTFGTGQVIFDTYETRDGAHKGAFVVSTAGLFISRDGEDEEFIPPARILRVLVDEQAPPGSPDCDEFPPLIP